jgi:hypothetical protein
MSVSAWWRVNSTQFAKISIEVAYDWMEQGRLDAS